MHLHTSAAANDHLGDLRYRFSTHAVHRCDASGFDLTEVVGSLDASHFVQRSRTHPDRLVHFVTLGGRRAKIVTSALDSEASASSAPRDDDGVVAIITVFAMDRPEPLAA